jgi:PAS domain S-box-containing protein
MRAKKKEAQELRGRAEKSTPPVGGLVTNLDRNDMANLVHELEDSQLELDLQHDELQRTQLELRESRNSYAELYDFAPVGYVTIGRRYAVTSANLKACTLLGVDRSQLIRSRFTRFVAPESQDHFYFHLKRAFDTSATQTVEVCLRRGDGIEFWAEMQSQVTGDRVCRTAFWDVSERKDQKDYLKLQADMLDSVGQAVIATDAKGKVVYWNKAAEAMYGWSASEAAGRVVVDLISAPRGRASGAAIMKELLRGREWAGEYLVQDRGGREIYVMVHDTPLMDQNGNLVGVIGVSWDITELKLVEQEIVRHRDSLQDLVSERTRELAMANPYLTKEVGRRRKLEHELRVLSRRLISAQENERLSIARDLHDDFGQRLNFLKMTTDKLALSTSGETRAAMNDVSLQITDLIHQVRVMSHELRPAALADLGLVKALEWYFASYKERTGIEVEYYHRANSVSLDIHISANAYRIVQEALANVARHTQVDRVRVTLSVNRKNLHLTVVDRGCGFEAGKVNAEAAGITSMRERAELVGGTILIESATGKGTSVILNVPLKSDKSPRRRRTGKSG